MGIIKIVNTKGRCYIFILKSQELGVTVLIVPFFRKEGFCIFPIFSRNFFLAATSAKPFLV